MLTFLRTEEEKFQKENLGLFTDWYIFKTPAQATAII